MMEAKGLKSVAHESCKAPTVAVYYSTIDGVGAKFGALGM